MKKLVLGLTVAGIVGLSGCGDGPEEPVIPEGTGGVGSTALTKAVYSPSTGSIPLPNDLLFGGTVDLTLNIPVADAADYSDPKVALSGLDGWSAIAPMAISFANGDGTDLDPATITPASIRVFETDVYRPEVLPGTGIIAPTGPVTGVASELVFGVDFVATWAGPLTVAIIPLRPFTQQVSYMVIATNGLKDAKGNAVTADLQYTFAKGSDPLGGSIAALEPVRQLVNAMEAAAVGEGIAKDDIILSYQFTVQSVGKVMGSAKGFYVDFPFSQNVFPTTNFTPLNIPSNGINPALSGDALISVGSIDLNYMLEAPDLTADPIISPTVVATGFWKTAAMVPDGAGGMMPNPGGAGGNLTYANSLPQVNSVETVPLLVSLPSNEACPKPYPVMIFQHGITSNRTAMLGIADTMAKICTAVISMDMPLHGLTAENGAFMFTGYEAGGLRERTFGVDLVNNVTGAPGADEVVDSSGTHTINLQNLLASRDNERQAIFDLLTLEKAIPVMDINLDTVPDFDASKVYFMGHSLGGIVGSSFVAYSDLVKTAILANPGGGIAGLLDGSDTFGPRIRAGLAAAGVEPGSADYNTFLFAAQMAIDSGDPANTAAFAVEKNIPTLMLRVAGDTVVPNNVATFPLSGTDPLAALLGLTTVTATEPGETVVGSRLISRLNKGTHSTVLLPDVPLVTLEMQTHIATFIGSGGAAIQVVDPTLLN